MMKPAKTANTELLLAAGAAFEIVVVPVISDWTLLTIEVSSER